MNTATQEIIVNWPIKALFNYICDIENNADWQPAVFSAEWTGNARHVTGSRFIETRIVNGKKEPVLARVQEHIPFERRSMVFKNGRVQSLWTFDFESLDNDSTRLQFKVLVKTSGPLQWTERFIAERIVAEKMGELTKLKTQLETESDSLLMDLALSVSVEGELKK